MARKLSEKLKIVVDTLSPWDTNDLIAALRKHDISPEDVDYLICTHGHPDHVGNNNLFISEKVTHIVGWSIYKKDIYYDHPFKDGQDYRIDANDLVVMPTPGHTLDSISVKVATEIGTVVIAGDLFEKEEDLCDETIWKEAGSESESDQMLHRAKVLEMADFIVPGHGPMFKVNKSKPN